MANVKDLLVNGSARVIGTIYGNATSANKVNHSLTFGSKSFNGSSAQTITLADLGGKPTQSAVSSPSASGTEISFIDTISQNANGVITATKKTVRDASASQSGVVNTGAQTFAGNKTFYGNITIGSMNGDTVVGAGNFKIGVRNDSYGVMPYANNWNSIGAGGLYWYRAYITNYYGTNSYITNYSSNGNIGSAAGSSNASTLGYFNFYNNAAAGSTQTKTKITAHSEASENLTITLPKTNGILLNEGNYNDFALAKISSSTDNAIVRWDGTDGKKVQNSLITINDSGDISGVGNIYPLADNSKNLGSSSLKWANIHATTFHGALDGNASGLNYHPILNTDDAINNFNAANTFKAAIWTSTSSPGVSNGIILSGGYASTSYGFQIAIDDDPGWYIALRQRTTDGWRAWKRIPMGDGTGASGTWNISISGNAATATKLGKSGLSADNIDNVTHAGLIYGTIGSYSGPGFASSDAMILSMSWDNSNNYGAQIALDDTTTPNMYVRNKSTSWSAWSKVLLSTNYTDYTVKKDGTGASGAWNIGITGNAATATKLATARTISLSTDASGSTSFDGSANVTIATTNLRLSQNTSTTSSDPGGLTWLNLDGTAGASVDVNDTPTSGWWYVIRNRHTNTSNNFYTDLAIPFNDNSLYYKIVRNGAVANGGWIKVLDTLNYTGTLDSRYVKKAGDTMTGMLNMRTENGVALNFRPQLADYYTTISYQTTGNEALVFASKQAVTSFIFVNGEDSVTNHSSDRWNSITPGLQIKNNCVSIGSLIANGVTPSYKLSVTGTSYFNGNTTHNGIDYFANGTTYYINNSAQAYLNNVSIGGVNFGHKLYVDGTSYLNGALTVNGNIYVNQTDGAGTGISLYSTSSPATSYGIMFATTGNYGTHGYVTGDWATYFTMDTNANSTPNRGWIFRNPDTNGNVASINTAGNAAFNQYIQFSNTAHIATNRSTDYHHGYTFNTGDNSKNIGIYSGTAGECGAVVVSPDGCLIYNSSDSGYNLDIHDKDLGSDLASADTRTFCVTQSGYYAWSRGGFQKNGSSDSYVLLGGGGHELISNLSVANADTLDGYHFSDLENKYVNVTGDTMSGTLKFNDSQQIFFKGKGNSDSVYCKMGFMNGIPAGVVHCVNTANHQTDGAFYITSNGYNADNDHGGIAIDNEGVTVFGAGDPGNNFTGVFRVINEDNVAGGPIFRVQKDGNAYATKLYGAVWNDYAEYRQSDITEPGRVVIENGDGTLSLSTKRLQRGAEVISDTYGFAIGETDECKTPIAAIGRVLAYTYEPVEEYKSKTGWPVCSGPNGTVSIMTEEEEEKYPSRIIGTISEVPDYEEWGTGKVKTNGRVWIRIK